MIFHATDNANYEGIRERGLVLEATRATRAGGVTSPGPGTVVKYGPCVFYCNLDYESYLNHGHELYLTDNGVVLAYQSIAPMYLTFTTGHLTRRILAVSATRRNRMRQG